MKEALSYFTDTHLTLIGLLLFFGWFIGMCYFVFKKMSPQYHEFMAQIPLQNEGQSHE